MNDRADAIPTYDLDAADDEDAAAAAAAAAADEDDATLSVDINSFASADDCNTCTILDGINSSKAGRLIPLHLDRKYIELLATIRSIILGLHMALKSIRITSISWAPKRTEILVAVADPPEADAGEEAAAAETDVVPHAALPSPSPSTSIASPPPSPSPVLSPSGVAAETGVACAEYVEEEEGIGEEEVVGEGEEEGE
jgi:hypothetical protein